MNFLNFLFLIFLICFYQNLAESQLIDLCSHPKNRDLIACEGVEKFECNPFGTAKINENGCSCKKNVIGKKCDKCRDGYWSLEESCKPCNCGPYSLHFKCNQKSGQCYCRPSVNGKRCDHIMRI